MDTSAFYSESEQAIHNQLSDIIVEKLETEKQINKCIQKQKKDENFDVSIVDEMGAKITELNKQYGEIKKSLYPLLQQNTSTRILNSESLKPSTIVALFDSVVTRTFGMVTNELSTNMFIVRAYFFDVLKSLIENGFHYNNEKYIFFSASAGQIRTKKTVFIKESLWNQYSKTLMCGLSITDINDRGGININKYLAYLSLCSGATEPLDKSIFDIRKTIVVPDFETLVHGTVDYIDQKTYSIDRKEMGVPINHCDGAGMILPRLSKKNFMLRAPWIKGLLTPFAFDEFCRERGHNGDIVDIYDRKWNIFDDQIEIILTKSQFKLWKYYCDWQEYVENFIKFDCEAGMCNEEEDHFKNARFNYQMLQTLPDMSTKELESITHKVRRNIKSIASDKQTMLKIMGVTPYNTNKTYLQQALEIYPEMLADNYCKEILKMSKRKMVKDSRCGKFEINGKYTFVVPDMYAFCENLFLGIETPKGLLKDGEVHCELYSYGNDVDCLRSPHLYREHAIRQNVSSESIEKWFITKGCYVSTYDLISKLLMCDWDGDKLLVCADKTIIGAAKRNMEGIVPLYYEMGSAEPKIVESGNIYDGLVFAFAHCNIGMISNDISKVWNGNDMGLDAIKILTAENNFLID